MKLNAKDVAGFLQPINIFDFIVLIDTIHNFHTIIHTEGLQQNSKINMYRNNVKMCAMTTVTIALFKI